MSDRLREALDAWMEAEDGIADIGVIVQAARKVVAGPSPEAVQAAADAHRVRANRIPYGDPSVAELEAMAAGLAAAWATDFGGDE